MIGPILIQVCQHDGLLEFTSQSPLDETIKNENYDRAIDFVLDVLETLVSFTIDGGVTKEMNLLLSKSPY